MQIRFHNEKVIALEETGQTLLDIALNHNIPHVSACGGKAQCSTCRVMMLQGHGNIEPISEKEQRLARTKGFEHNVRLACQAKVCGDVTVRRLVFDKDDIDLAVQQKSPTTGKQQKLAVMFTDIRSFTPFVENNLAYDVVHILNRYFYQMGQVILRNNGMIDKYMGDGLMALFGVDSLCSKETCFQAVSAALDMKKQLDLLNGYLCTHFDLELAIGIGIDFGEVLVGNFGHPEKQHFTAIGNVVNQAARVEAKTKEFDTDILITQAVAQELDDKINLGRHFVTSLKGVANEQNVFEVNSFGDWALEQENLCQQIWRELSDHVAKSDAPKVLRLAYHDAAAFDAQTGKGGANGSIRIESEIKRPENRGLETAIEVIKPVKLAHPDVSWADIIAIAGAVAVAITGGPRIHVPMGRSDSAHVSPEGSLAYRKQSIEDLVQHFTILGFSLSEFVALCGGHTLGMADGKPMTTDPFNFSNRFYTDLLNYDLQSLNRKYSFDESVAAESSAWASGMVESDYAMLTHPETLKWVQRYALSEADFFTDFALAYQKLSTLGTNIWNGAKKG